MKRVLGKTLAVLGILAVLILGYGYVTQSAMDHSDASFTPDYDRLPLTGDMEAETLFQQTGLSPAAAQAVLAQEGVAGLERYQEAFFAQKDVACTNIFTYITRQDVLPEGATPGYADAQPGDIILSLSPHSAGWRHGHAAIVITDTHVLQLTEIFKSSGTYRNTQLKQLSQYAVLRLKDRPEAFSDDLTFYAMSNLQGVRYSLLGCFFGEKAPAPEDPDFALMCTSLAWYAYYQLGYDIDSDGGDFVSGQDILDSPLLEVVQVFGMDPREFEDRMAQ